MDNMDLLGIFGYTDSSDITADDRKSAHDGHAHFTNPLN